MEIGNLSKQKKEKLMRRNLVLTYLCSQKGIDQLHIITFIAWILRLHYILHTENANSSQLLANSVQASLPTWQLATVLHCLLCLNLMSTALLCITNKPGLLRKVSLDLHCTCTNPCGRRVRVLAINCPSLTCEQSSRFEIPSSQSLLLLHKEFVLPTSVMFPLTSHSNEPQALVQVRMTASDLSTIILDSVPFSRAAKGDEQFCERTGLTVIIVNASSKTHHVFPGSYR